MKRSPEIDQFADAMALAQAAMKNPSKDAKADTGGKRDFMYATLDALIDAGRPALSANAIAYMQAPEENDRGVLVVTTLLIHSSGQWVETETPIVISAQYTPQQLGSAITYAKRYGFGAITGLTADQDDDGNAAKDQIKTGHQGAHGGRTAPSSPPPAPPPPAVQRPAQRPPDAAPEAKTDAGQAGQAERGFVLTWPPDVFTGKVVTRDYPASGQGALDFLGDLIRALGTNRHMLKITTNQESVHKIRLWAADDPKRTAWLEKIVEAEDLAANPIGGAT